MTPIDPAILAKFETWLRTMCFQKPTPEAHDLAKEAASHFYQLCAAEKQAEIDALTARIATLERENAQLLAEADALESKLHDLEQQRQQDREDAARYRWLCCKKIIPNPSLWDSGVGFLCHLKGLPSSGAATSEQLAGAIDAARAKEPSNG